jgi:hypothetical protein
LAAVAGFTAAWTSHTLAKLNKISDEPSPPLRQTACCATAWTGQRKLEKKKFTLNILQNCQDEQSPSPLNFLQVVKMSKSQSPMNIFAVCLGIAPTS